MAFTHDIGQWAGKLGGGLEDFGAAYAGKPDYEPTDPFHLGKGPRYDEELARELGTRGRQVELNDAITQRALGKGGPSVAELQQRAGIQQASAAAMGLAASARGSNRALAQRGAQSAQANLAADAASKGAMLRASEQIAAQGLASQNWQAMRMADLQDRGLSFQESKAVLDAEVARMNARTQAESQEAERAQRAAGGVLTAVGGLISDIKAKENIQPAGPTYAEQLNAQVANLPVSAGPRGGIANYKDPYALDQQMMYGAPQASPYGANPYEAPKPQQQEGGGGGIADFFKGLGSVSDARAKEGAFAAGLVQGATLGVSAAQPAAAPAMQRAHVSSQPLFDLGSAAMEARVKSTRKDTAKRSKEYGAKREAWREAADALIDARQVDERDPGYAPPASAPASPAAQPPAAVPAPTSQQLIAALAPTVTYSPGQIQSDRRAKELGTENERLKSDLDAMGRALTAQISGNPPTARFADVPSATRASLAPVNPYQFSYKPEFAAKYGEDTSPRTGVMAQELLKSPAYAPAVQQQPDGMLALDGKKLLQANTAMIAGQDKRLAQDEAVLAAAIKAIGDEQELKTRRGRRGVAPAPRSDRYSEYLEDAR